MANYYEGIRYRVVGDGTGYTYSDGYLNRIDAERECRRIGGHVHVEEYRSYHHEEGTDFLAP